MKKYIYFAGNSLLFPTVKKFSKSVNSWSNYYEKFDTTFFKQSTLHCPSHPCLSNHARHCDMSSFTKQCDTWCQQHACQLTQ